MQLRSYPETPYPGAMAHPLCTPRLNGPTSQGELQKASVFGADTTVGRRRTCLRWRARMPGKLYESTKEAHRAYLDLQAVNKQGQIHIKLFELGPATKFLPQRTRSLPERSVCNYSKTINEPSKALEVYCSTSGPTECRSGEKSKDYGASKDCCLDCHFGEALPVVARKHSSQ